jgi:hypothetical protein
MIRLYDWTLRHPFLQLSCSFVLAALVGLASSLVTR